MQYCDNVPSGNSTSSVPSANQSVMHHDSGTNVLTVLYLVVSYYCLIFAIHLSAGHATHNTNLKTRDI